MSHTISTPRLVLRPYATSDRDAFVALNTDPVVRAHMNGPLTEAAARQLHERLVAQARGPAQRAWAITDRGGGRYLGHAYHSPSEEADGPELGFLLVPGTWGQGFATEVAAAIADHLLASGAAPEVFATVDLDHGASQRVLEKIGMVVRRRCRDEQGEFLLYGRRAGRADGELPVTRDLPCARTERFAKPASTTWRRADGHDWSDTPACRESSFGHRLELDRPPTAQTLNGWFDRWAAHHGGKGVERAYLCVETTAPWAPPPLPPGVSFDPLTVLQLAGPAPERATPAGTQVRPFEHDEDWAQQAALTITVEDEDNGPLRRYFAWYTTGLRARHDAGQGRYWGAFNGGELVASAGLFWAGGEARFQHVQTHPAHRRRGLCSALVSAACVDARREARAGPIFIAATTGTAIARLYRSLGFRPCSWYSTLGRAVDTRGPSED